MRIKLIIFVSTFSIFLCACSLKLKIGLINNSGQTVVVISDSNISVSHGGIARFFYPTIARQRRFQISISNCTFIYEMPSFIENYVKLEGFDGEVMVQLERNNSLYLVPPASLSVIALSEVESLQNEGFPVAPVEEKCG